MLNFCTLFDSNYLAKGLCMYNSLKEACPDFQLFIFAFDDKTLTLLAKLKLDKVVLISLAEFEDPELLNIKPTRTKAEYCWTCSSSTIHYCLNNFDINHCTYIDSDLFFYNDPTVLIDEMGNDDVLIIDHRYTTIYDQSSLSGKYCVQFMTFKKTGNGLKILNWWREACIKWCYNRREDGKFGDQKYLDDWMTRFEGVHELQYLGGGVAPWNVQQYDIRNINNTLIGIEKATGNPFELIFYHFHHLSNQNFQFFNEFNLGPYLLSKSITKYVYIPYIKRLKHIDKNIKSIDNSFDCLGSSVTKFGWFKLGAHYVKNSLRKNKIIWLR